MLLGEKYFKKMTSFLISDEQIVMNKYFKILADFTLHMKTPACIIIRPPNDFHLLYFLSYKNVRIYFYLQLRNPTPRLVFGFWPVFVTTSR